MTTGGVELRSYISDVYLTVEMKYHGHDMQISKT